MPSAKTVTRFRNAMFANVGTARPLVRAARQRQGKQVATDAAIHQAQRVIEKLTTPQIVKPITDRPSLVSLGANGSVVAGKPQTDNLVVVLEHDIPGLIENCRGRLGKLNRAAVDHDFAKEEQARCSVDFIYWVTWYGWTYDPRLPVKFLPFIPFDKQAEFSEYITQLRAVNMEGIVEKSRDMGASWLVVAYFVWCWLYEDGFAGLFASRKVETVDKLGDPKSIFEKVRTILRYLPKWMLPAGWDPVKHSVRLKVVNPATGATLTGEGGIQIGRGGRATMVLVDEAAFLDNPDAVDSALSETADVKIWLSTPNKPGDSFAQKRRSGHFPVFTLHWLMDPRKNRWIGVDALGLVVAEGHGSLPGIRPAGAVRMFHPYYERVKRKLNMDLAKVAREVDINYDASSEGTVIPPEWIRAAVGLELDPIGPVEGGLDVSSGQGPDSTVLITRRGPVIRPPKTVKARNTTLQAQEVARIMARESGVVLHYDAVAVGEGVRGEMESGTAAEGRQFRLHGVMGGDSPTNRKWTDDGRRAKEMFENLRAELYWNLRERFRKAFEYRQWLAGDPEGIEHPHDEMISIPNHKLLIEQLPTVTYFENNKGKYQLLSKKEMAAQGIKSPDYADALAYSFAPERKRKERVGSVTVMAPMV